MAETGFHVTLHQPVHDLNDLRLYNSIAGAVCVEHARGLVKEHPHYHIWIPSGISTKPTEYAATKMKKVLCEWLKKEHPTVSLNNTYCVKPHDSFEQWRDYVIRSKCKYPKLIFWNRSESPPEFEEPRSMDELIIPAQNVQDTPVAVIKEKKKDPCYKRFYAFVISEQYPTDTISQVMDAWIDWTNGNYELRNVSAPIRYVFYMKHKDTDKGASIRQIMKSEIADRFFSDYNI